MTAANHAFVHQDSFAGGVYQNLRRALELMFAGCCGFHAVSLAGRESAEVAHSDNIPMSVQSRQSTATEFSGFLSREALCRVLSRVHSWMFDLDNIHVLLRNLSCERNVHKAGILAREVSFMLQSNAEEATRTSQRIASQSVLLANRRNKPNRTLRHLEKMHK